MSQHTEIIVIFEQTPGDAPDKWTENFIHFNELIINRLLEKPVNISRSPDLERSNRQERSQLLASSHAVLVILSDVSQISPSLTLWFEALEDALAGKETKPKILKIIKNQSALVDQIPVLKSVLPITFYTEQDHATHASMLYDEMMVYEAERQYWIKLVDLAYDLYFQVSERRTGHPLIKADKTIYLAFTSPDQDRNRSVLERELKRFGFTILPATTLPDTQAAFSAAVTDALSRSQLSIHIFGDESGATLSDAAYSIVDLQNKIAADYYSLLLSEEESPSLSRYIWVSPYLSLTNERQRLKLEQLTRDPSLLKGAELVKAPLEKFKSMVLSRLTASGSTETGETHGRAFYVIAPFGYDTVISPYVTAIQSAGFDCLALAQGNTRQLINTHYKYLLSAVGVLLYVPENHQIWFDRKITDMIKSPGMGRETPFQAVLVVTADKSLIVPQPTALPHISVYHTGQNGMLTDVEAVLKRLTQSLNPQQV